MASRSLLALLFAAASAVADGPSRPGMLGVNGVSEGVAHELGLPQGAGVLEVVPRSPADRAGLKPGDLVTAVQQTIVRNFNDLHEAIQGLSPGDEINIAFARGAQKQTVRITLASRAAEMTDVSRRAKLKFLEQARVVVAGPLVPGEIAESHWELGERALALKELAKAAAKFPEHEPTQIRYLDLLLKNGRYGEFLPACERAATRLPASAEIRLQLVDGLLSAGRLLDAETAALALARRSYRNEAFVGYGARAMKFWYDARIRQGKSFSGGADADILDAAWNNPDLAVARSWRDLLQGERTYQLVSGAHASVEVEQEKAAVLFGLVPQKMHGVSIKVNGVTVPLAIVDTGASHTLISDTIAQQAHVETTDVRRGASGSLDFIARPGLIRELQIGSIILRNVPVSVGDPPPLVMTKAKAALGVDLMHHLRFTIDYARSKVRVQPARTTTAPAPAHPESVWDIPLYTFGDHCLTEAKLPDGSSARTLIDSGNFAQTLLWPQWGKEHVPNHRGPSKSLFDFAMSKPLYDLKDMTLGGRTLPTWPTMDMPPVTLQGVDLLDILMGHDLLSQYTVTVDMQNRRLRLESPGAKFIPPTPPPAMPF